MLTLSAPLPRPQAMPVAGSGENEPPSNLQDEPEALCEKLATKSRLVDVAEARAIRAVVLDKLSGLPPPAPVEVDDDLVSRQPGSNPLALLRASARRSCHGPVSLTSVVSL